MLGFKVVTKTFDFQTKNELLKFPVLFHDLVQSSSRYCKKLSYNNSTIHGTSMLGVLIMQKASISLYR